MTAKMLIWKERILDVKEHFGGEAAGRKQEVANFNVEYKAWISFVLWTPPHVFASNLS